MRSLFPSTYDRADVLMSAGCSTFVSAALILVIPRVGIVLLEILLGLFFIGCALAARARLRIQARSQVKEGPEGSTNAKAKWFDRYDVLMILTVIVIYSSMSGLLRHEPRNGARPRALNREMVTIVQHEQRKRGRSGSPVG